MWCRHNRQSRKTLQAHAVRPASDGRSRSAVCSREPPFSATECGQRHWFPSCRCLSRKTAWCQLVGTTSVAVFKTLDGTRCATHTRRVSVVSPPPKGASSPEPVHFDRSASFPRTERLWALPTPPGTRFRQVRTRQPFRCRIVPGTTRKHANEPVTALPRTRPATPFAPAKDEPTPTQATLPDYGV